MLWTSTFLRINNGHAAAVTYAHEKIRIPNSYHYSDYFTARHTSYIVPKGSPLQVLKCIKHWIQRVNAQ